MANFSQPSYLYFHTMKLQPRIIFRFLKNRRWRRVFCGKTRKKKMSLLGAIFLRVPMKENALTTARLVLKLLKLNWIFTKKCSCQFLSYALIAAIMNVLPKETL